MPNWCNNSITINGDKDKIKQIRDVLETMDKRDDSIGIFEYLVGRDKNITEEQYRNGGWYDHNINRYGCKWDVSYRDAVIDGDDEYITMNPNTAWSPPKDFCRLLAEQYGVDVELEYWEAGNDFAGKLVVDSNGDDVENLQYDYLEGLYFIDEDYFWMEVQSNLQCEFEWDEPRTLEVWLEDFTFVSDVSKQELTELYNELKEQQESN